MKFSELTGTARAKALDKMSEWNTDYEWWDDTYEHFTKEIAPMRGFHIEEINFQGFYFQGSGASWNGSVDLLKWIEWRIKSNPTGPNAPVLRVLQALIENGYVSENTRVTNYGRYHSMRVDELDPGYTYDIDILLHEGPYKGAPVQELISAIDWVELDELLTDDIKEQADEIFSALESEYEYLTSDEACADLAEANGYEFNDKGELQ